MIPLNPQMPSGPIPGENFTTNEKNYPWHRPMKRIILGTGHQTIRIWILR
jgi:hypothetical protein